MSWRLPERVKRLAMPTYRYGPVDLAHMGVVVAEDGDAGVVGVAAWEEAARRDCPRGRRALLLQGIYVDPDRHRRGLGARLLAASAEAARRQGLDGVLVKAQPDAIGFFEAQGLSRLPVEDPERDYPHRYWLDISPRASG
jgi:GNAT superfamily N-acetyltransferase